MRGANTSHGGAEKYVFIGGNGLGDSLLDAWPFAVQHPEALLGITTVSGGACQTSTPQYALYVRLCPRTRRQPEQ